MESFVIKIGGLDYHVDFLPSEAMNGQIGLADFNRQRIMINADHTIQTQRIAVLHEVLHILEKTWNLKWDEEAVTYTTHALISLFSDNPDFIIRIQSMKEY